MSTPTEKLVAFSNLALRGVVMVHLDARLPGVQVPDHLRSEAWLRLNFGHTHGKGDLTADEWGVRETLRFRGAWCTVSVPWSAVFGVSSPGGSDFPRFFSDALPAEVGVVKETAPKPSRRHLRLVKA